MAPSPPGKRTLSDAVRIGGLKICFPAQKPGGGKAASEANLSGLTVFAK